MTPQRISRDVFFRLAEESYGWDLTVKEKEILEGLARLHTGSIVLDNWEIFQKKYPGHPAWEFCEWFEELGFGEENHELYSM